MEVYMKYQVMVTTLFSGDNISKKPFTMRG